MIDPLIRRLEEEQAAFAKEALSRPSGRDDFEYGRVCGIYAGLERAREIIFNSLADKDAKQNQL